MNATVTKLCGLGSVTLPAELLALHVDKQQIEADVARLALRYADESETDTAKAGDIVRCAADEASYPDGRTVLLYPGAGIPGAEEAEAAAIGAHPDDTLRVTLCGRAAALTIRSITRRTPVAVNDALIARIGLDGVNTVDDYRAMLREKALADAKMEKSKQLAQLVVQQMLAGSEIDYDERALAAHIDGELPAALAEFAAYGIEADEQEVRAELANQQQQSWLAKAFCAENGITVDEKQVEDEAAQMYDLMQMSGETLPARERFLAQMVEQAYISEFFMAVNAFVAQKMEG